MARAVESSNLRTINSARGANGLATWRVLQRHWFVYVCGLVMPVAFYAVFIGYPILHTLYLSLARWNGLESQIVFVGLQNFLDLTRDPNFTVSLVNNIKWAVLSLLVPVVLGLLMAVLLHSGKIYFSGVFRSIIFLPTTMALVTIGIMFALILNPVFGAWNEALRVVGLGALAHDWLGDPNTALYSLIAVFAWGYLGLPLMLFHAGISEIPVELYEASRIEGASGFQTLRYITVPLLKPVATVVTMLTVINSLRAFDLVMVMTRGGPFKQTAVLGYLMYTEAFANYRFGYGAAISIVVLLLSSVFAAIYLRNVAGESLYVS